MPEPNAASVALLDRGKVLLIRRAFEPFAGRWTLPGGRREAGESILDCAAREIAEELGLKVFGLRPVMEMAVGEGAAFRLKVFATEGFEGSISPSAEVLAWRWLRPGGVGILPTTPGLAGVVERAFAIFDRR
jgi:8-oxo-dGTP diphosphatase